jgi:hypothetical protein
MTVGDASIRTPPSEPGSPLVIGTSARFAGAVSSVELGSVQFCNASDHGRCFQSDMLLDGLGIAKNPTEAGSEHDGGGSTSSSHLLFFKQPVVNNLSSINQAAYWKAWNGHVLSPDRITKTITIGALGRPHLVKWAVKFTLAEDHSSSLFEVLTGYMPPTFGHWQTLDGSPLVSNPSPEAWLRYTSQPLLCCINPVTGSALGFYCSPVRGGIKPAPWAPPVYTFGTRANDCTKWNAWNNVSPAPTGDYSYTMWLAMGTIASVRNDLAVAKAQLN